MVASSTQISDHLVHRVICWQSQSPFPSSYQQYVHVQHRSLGSGPKQKKMSRNQQGDSSPRNKKFKSQNQGWQQTGRSTSRLQQKRNVQPVTRIRPPKNYIKRLPKATKEPVMPPAMLAPTASPYVFVAQTALVTDYFGRGEDPMNDSIIDPSTLFAEAFHTIVSDDSTGSVTTTIRNVLPPLFAKGDFEYFSPKRDLGHDYPAHGRPEVAFLGRSNVGKSSLINALMRKNLCITSKSPGRTQLPYYYGLIPKSENIQQQQQQQRQGSTTGKTEKTTLRSNNPSIVQGYIIDLPGYGYGRAPKAIVEDWQKDTQDLLLHRRHTAGVLQRLFLLLDARRGGPSELDRTIMRWLEDADIPYTIVITKADRISFPLVVRQVNDFCLRYASLSFDSSSSIDDEDDDDDSGGYLSVTQSPVIHITSSAKGWGIHELLLSVEAEFIDGEEYDDDGGDVV
jgi:GTP-binding protein EngB required for normal cell division